MEIFTFGDPSSVRFPILWVSLNLIYAIKWGDSQENNKGKSRDKDNYVSWTMEDTNELLHLLVDAMNRGLRDANGSLSKQNVERIILPQLNAKTKFMYVLSGWEGSAHDSKVLSDALARKNGLKVPQGKYYLVDCGFPNRRKFLAPYRGVRYHLQDFAGHGNDPENEKELFNLRHASLRNVIERIFGIFKSRFTIFKSAPPFLFKTQAELVLACAALHNFLRKECRSISSGTY
ncbi:hypothetical protein JHK85_034243 [Glycine max]|nr:hypothetical protein JHK85_034243 [Glycine max]